MKKQSLTWKWWNTCQWRIEMMTICNWWAISCWERVGFYHCSFKVFRSWWPVLPLLAAWHVGWWNMLSGFTWDACAISRYKYLLRTPRGHSSGELLVISSSLYAAMLLWLIFMIRFPSSPQCPRNLQIRVIGWWNKYGYNHETALVTCFRALDNINTRLYAYNQ